MTKNGTLPYVNKYPLSITHLKLVFQNCRGKFQNNFKTMFVHYVLNCFDTEYLNFFMLQFSVSNLFTEFWGGYDEEWESIGANIVGITQNLGLKPGGL